MKQLLFFLIFISFFGDTYSSEINTIATDDSLKIKNWAKEDFIKEFGSSDSATALINFFFIKNKRGKNQTIIGGAFLIGGVTAMATPFEHNNDAKDFGEFVRPVAEPGATALGVVLATSGIVKLKRYSTQKLYILLSDHKNQIPIPKHYRKKLRPKFFVHRQTLTSRF